jgi:hypothetical protein
MERAGLPVKSLMTWSRMNEERDLAPKKNFLITSFKKLTIKLKTSFLSTK